MGRGLACRPRIDLKVKARGLHKVPADLQPELGDVRGDVLESTASTAFDVEHDGQHAEAEVLRRIARGQRVRAIEVRADVALLELALGSGRA